MITFGVLTTMALLLAAGGLYWTLNSYQNITFLKVPTVEAAPPGEPVNWLLVGSDTREGINPDDPDAGAFLNGELSPGKRTDVIIVARVDPKAKSVDLLSIPRDLWVPITGTGENGRINSAFTGEGGEQRLVATVEDVFDIDINNYAEVNFVGFKAIIDSLGGVPIYFETPVRDERSGLNVEVAGCHVLDGSQSLAFARARHLEYYEDGRWKSDITSDFGRVSRQQYLIQRVADISASKLDLTNIGTINSILTVGGKNLVIDDGASARDLFGLARTFAGVGSEGIRRHALPTASFTTAGGADVLDLIEDEAQPILDIFRGRLAVDATVPPSTEVVPRDSFTIDVANGARIARLATNTAAELTGAGFVVGNVGDADEAVERTIVRYPTRLAAGASVLGTSLTVGPLYEADDTLTTVELILGPDFEGLGGASATPTTTAPAITVPTEPPQDENITGVIPGPGPPGTPCAA